MPHTLPSRGAKSGVHQVGRGPGHPVTCPQLGHEGGHAFLSFLSLRVAEARPPRGKGTAVTWILNVPKGSCVDGLVPTQQWTRGSGLTIRALLSRCHPSMSSGLTRLAGGDGKFRRWHLVQDTVSGCDVNLASGLSLSLSLTVPFPATTHSLSPCCCVTSGSDATGPGDCGTRGVTRVLALPGSGDLSEM